MDFTRKEMTAILTIGLSNYFYRKGTVATEVAFGWEVPDFVKHYIRENYKQWIFDHEMGILDLVLFNRKDGNLMTWGFEIKSSREDFLSDKKWKTYLWSKYLDRFTFLCPDGVITDNDLGEWKKQVGIWTYSKEQIEEIHDKILKHEYIWALPCIEKKTYKLTSRKDIDYDFESTQENKHRLLESAMTRSFNYMINDQECPFCKETFRPLNALSFKSIFKEKKKKEEEKLFEKEDRDILVMQDFFEGDSHPHMFSRACKLLRQLKYYSHYIRYQVIGELREDFEKHNDYQSISPDDYVKAAKALKELEQFLCIRESFNYIKEGRLIFSEPVQTIDISTWDYPEKCWKCFDAKIRINDDGYNAFCSHNAFLRKEDWKLIPKGDTLPDFCWWIERKINDN